MRVVAASLEHFVSSGSRPTIGPLADEVHLWEVGANDQLSPVARAPLNLESRLQEWLTDDISILDPGLLVIGREVPTDFGGFIDILCVDAAGDIVIVELKRDRTPREITAQALDYASWVVNLSNERITSIADAYLHGDFEGAFKARFGTDVPETLNGSHRIVIVASEIDPGSERIVRYLSDAHGVNINAATFHYFRPPGGSELLARVFLIEASEVELNTRTKGTSKRAPRLTYEDLQATAAQNGVGDLYAYAVDAFERTLQKHTTRTTLSLAASIDGSRKTILSLLPLESSNEKGLCFRVYKHRYAEIAGLSVEAVESRMPAEHREWSYIDNDDPEWEGYEAFFRTRSDVDELASPLVSTNVTGRRHISRR